MRKSAILAIALLTAAMASGQDTLFTENFQAPTFQLSLNTSDVGSTPTGYNQWIVNSQYAGGSGSGTVCGFPVTFMVPTTPGQPGAVAGSPQSAYLHTVSDLAVSNGISNCCFLAADGFCNFDETYFAAMNTDIGTTGYDTVTISFWWLCDGGNNSFGELYYSINGGASWTKYGGMNKFNNTASWTKGVYALPDFANQAQLRFGFRFVNNAALSASDPGFGVDEIVVAGVQNVVLPVAAFSASAVTFCEETCIDFTDQSTNMPTSWQWFFPGAMPDTSTWQNPQQICYSDTGFFDVTLIVSNGQGSDTLTLVNYIHSIANPPQPAITASGDTLCTLFSPGYTYQWYFNGTTVIPGATNYCYIAIFPGNYTVEITDVTGCKNLSDPFLVTGIGELHGAGSALTVSLSSGYLHVSAQAAGPLALYDAAGRMIYKGMLHQRRAVRWPVKGLPQGVYLLRAILHDRPETSKVLLR